MDGILNIYKERGFTSHDVVAKLRGIMRMKKIGHTGTLDPDACGVLPVCLGQATKVCSLLTDRKKTYEAVMLLGRETDTQDAGGRTVAERPVTVTERDVREVLAGFVGESEQIPPMYSALKVNGHKLCDLARQGKTVERKPRPVTFYEVEILSVQLPRVRFRVTCSKGTYIRTLCHDAGKLLGSGACMEELLRTQVEPFDVGDSLTLSQIEDLAARGQVETVLCPVDRLFEELPAVRILPEYARYMMNGNSLKRQWLRGMESESPEDENPAVRIRLYTQAGTFFGVYEYRAEEERYRLQKMFYGG